MRLIFVLIFSFFTLNSISQIKINHPAVTYRMGNLTMPYSPDQEMWIMVNINKLDTTLDYTKRMVGEIRNGELPYYWTWYPSEHPLGHPFANGIGNQAWKNSNETLKMNKGNDSLYYYAINPNYFYEANFSDEDTLCINFIIKLKDGGGFGDPDWKSEDLALVIYKGNLVSNFSSRATPTKELKVLPNPNNGRFFISLDNLQNITSARVVNCQGVVVKDLNAQEFNANNQVEVSMVGYPNGVYFIQLFSENELFSKRIILSK